MNELIKVNYENEEITILGRDLHEFLGVKTEYKDWFPRMLEYGFTENEDYCSFLSVRSDGLAGRQRTEHQITIDWVAMRRKLKNRYEELEDLKDFNYYCFNCGESFNEVGEVNAGQWVDYWGKVTYFDEYATFCPYCESEDYIATRGYVEKVQEQIKESLMPYGENKTYKRMRNLQQKN